MAKLGTWGDEICVKALCDCFEVCVYVILSTPGNWYLRYTPAGGFFRPKKIFLSYLSPIHYNSVTYMDDAPIRLTKEEHEHFPELSSFRGSPHSSQQSSQC
eukprot:TRINITY_DN7053_c0_g1_i1.p1 TRINITY_DN7053_c0_g1~~TRINITY_DN7053_c0_g1_i1.p1  ORF type:complete len:116 (+),score=42.12 TRINITY_DN7053_c0_g1_i1:48-350(+)